MKGEKAMSKLVVIEHLTLDGVMQGPGRPEEDPRDGFEFGGWAVAGNDPVMIKAQVRLNLVDSVTTGTGVIIATYVPAP